MSQVFGLLLSGDVPKELRGALVCHKMQLQRPMKSTGVSQGKICLSTPDTDSACAPSSRAQSYNLVGSPPACL